jgi:hypothetical protein
MPGPQPQFRSDADRQAWTIYEQICATSEDRPFAGRDAATLLKQIANWKSENPGLKALEKAAPEVCLAFLENSLDWLRAEAKAWFNFRACQSLSDAALIALRGAPSPLPPQTIVHLLSEYHVDLGGIYFPFEPLLNVIRREDVTDEIRVLLKRYLLRFAPTPTGKIDDRTTAIRNRLLELTRVEGERQLDPGRGPWSQLVFDELKPKDELLRATWEGLLEHCRTLEQTVPGAKWKKRTRELVTAIGELDAADTLRKWMELGPTPGQPSEARSPIEDSAYQKGVVWCLALLPSHENAIAIADFGIACLRKIPMIGAVSQKVGFACVLALGVMQHDAAVSQLTRVRMKVKYTVARRLIEKSLREAAERAGVTTEDLEDRCISDFGLDHDGRVEIRIADATAIIQLANDGRAAVIWKNADGKPVKSAPAPVRKAFPKEVKSVAALAKEIEQTYAAQRARLEASFLSPRTMPVAHWRTYFVEHPLLGFLGRRLIWAFQDEAGGEHAGLVSDGKLRDPAGKPLEVTTAKQVRLWHPLSSEDADIQRWRERVFTTGVRQPFRQAFREFYRISDDERQTRMYSNRFAGVLMRQHQFASLCRARGWEYRLMGTGFDGGNTPSLRLDAWSMHAELYVDLPPDRDGSLRDSALNEQSGAGINLFIGSDQVRFYRDRKEIAVEQVPAIVYSEVMRDVDLFTSVCEVGPDETWKDQGERGSGVFTEAFEWREINSVLALRAEIVERVLPQTSIADRCKVEKGMIEVRGQLGTYRIPLWGGAYLIAGKEVRPLRIPQKLLDAVDLDLNTLPLELDHRTGSALRKAHIVANDWKITDPDLIEQFTPK